MLIWSGQSARFNAKCLSHPVAVFIGLISYPLYLWHWPLLAFLRVRAETEPMLIARVGMVALAFVLAVLTYRLVEMPLRSSRMSRIVIVGSLSGAMLMLAIIGYLGYPNETVKPWLFPVNDCSGFLSADSEVYRYCRVIGDPGLKKTFLLWGDSHANSWNAGIATLAKKRGARVVQISHPGCPPLLGVRRSLGSGQAQLCSSFALADHVMAAIRKVHPDRIVLVARWSLYTLGLRSHGKLVENTFLTIDPHGKATPETSVVALRQQLPKTLLQLSKIAPVLVVKTVPTLHMIIDSGLARDPRGFEPSLSEYRAYEAIPNDIIDTAALNVPNVSVFDPAIVLCSQKCHAVMAGVRLYSDDSHLTDEGALLFPPALSRALP